MNAKGSSGYHYSPKNGGKNEKTINLLSIYVDPANFLQIRKVKLFGYLFPGAGINEF